jgi:hypothetical protein
MTPELPTTLEPFHTTLAAWRRDPAPSNAAALIHTVEGVRAVLELRLAEFEIIVRRPCGFFRNVPEHLSADDPRIGEVFANLEAIRRGWDAWLDGFHRFAPHASFPSSTAIEQSLSTHEYDELVKERFYVEQEGIELTNRTIQEIRDIGRKIDLIRDDPGVLRDPEEEIDAFERRRDALKKELEEIDPAKPIKLRIVEYLERLPDRMHALERAVDAISLDLTRSIGSLRLVATAVMTDTVSVERELATVTRTLDGTA